MPEIKPFEMGLEEFKKEYNEKKERNEKLTEFNKEDKRVISALSLLKEFKKCYTEKNAIDRLFTTQTSTNRNRISLLNRGHIKTAIDIKERIEKYDDNKNITSKKSKEEIYSDLYNFFISQNVCKPLEEEKALKIQGLYLLFRKSNVDNKIIISYLDVEFKNNTLFFKSGRNNSGTTIDKSPVNIKTNGIIISNTKNSYLCIGISKNIADKVPMSFVETMVLYKNDYGSDRPVSGYWSGNIVSKNNDPFVSKITLLKIKNQESIEKIKQEIKSSQNKNNKIITLHKKDELLIDSHIINIIIDNEKNITMEKGIKSILDSISMEIDYELDIFRLQQYS